MSESLQALIIWLSSVPSVVLYLVLASAAFLENLLPPLPADTVIALGAFLAARGQGTAWGAWLATMVGNVGGALLMYQLGARLGVAWLIRRIPGLGSPERVAQVGHRLATRGVAAVAISRLLPGIRALVPPMAGAIGLPWRGTAVAMALASGLWYGLVCWLAYTAGANADALMARIAAQQRIVGAVAAGVLAIGVARWWWRHRRRGAST